ncbi:MAG: hypothetical protein Q8L41_01035 [Anaerolineales bacterium]|nr:hypothetical protein [Anaerolineales bacterium]MDP2776068.1 hypothetical protein [Anaerolineales bacterium]
MECAEGTGGDAQAAVIATFDVNVGRFIIVNPHDGAHFANLSRQTAVAGMTVVGLKLDANLARHRFLALKHQHLVCCQRPVGEQFHAPVLDVFH